MSEPTAPRQQDISEVPDGDAHDLRGVLRIAAFRRLWIALSFSSLGDWLGLLATTALASNLAGADYARRNFAIAGVLILRLLPAVVLGPFAGVVADRLDRRWTMVICDVLRFSLFLSIPIVGQLWWLFAASFLIEAVSLFWIPAKEASVPNIVPRHRLQAANQLSLLTTYGSAPVAAGLFALLALLNGVLAAGQVFFKANPVDLALYFDAATFLFSAITIYRLHEIPRGAARPAAEGASAAGVLRTITEGWRFIGTTRVVRGLVTGMLGAFAAGGAVVGLARVYVSDLGGGDPAYGVLFGTVFLGLALGMFLGPRLLSAMSRRRLFGLAIVGAGAALSLMALIPNIVIVVLITLLLGGLSGVAWVTGYTMLGLEVEDAIRGRTFAFVQSTARVVLVLVLAAAPAIAGAIGRHRLSLTDDVTLTYNGAAITMFFAGLAALVIGVVSYRQMDDRRGVPLRGVLAEAVRGGLRSRRSPATDGLFIALEGGEGAGKSTQAERLAAWLREKGHDVVVTHEPGATQAGASMREMLLDPGHPPLSARTEALLYAADRAEHVERVIRPALERGAIVVSDRYVDSSIAYQGAGRSLGVDEVGRISRWATGGLVPSLTILLDLPPETGHGRFAGRDKLEAEPLEFHERVRDGFLALAGRDLSRHHIVDASAEAEVVASSIRSRLEPMLPPSAAELEAERRRIAAEQQRAAAERAENERAAAERAERDRADRERAERARAEAERLERERRERERAERERAEAERLERQRLEGERVERERAERDRVVAERAERERVERMEAQRERAERERAERQPAQPERTKPEPVRTVRPTAGRRPHMSLADELFGRSADAADNSDDPAESAGAADQAENSATSHHPVDERTRRLPRVEG